MFRNYHRETNKQKEKLVMMISATFMRKITLILFLPYIYRHWKENVRRVMMIVFNQRGLSGVQFFSPFPAAPLKLS